MFQENGHICLLALFPLPYGYLAQVGKPGFSAVPASPYTPTPVPVVSTQFVPANMALNGMWLLS